MEPAGSERDPARYDPETLETYWQRRWEETRCFESQGDGRRPRFFNFDGGPFPNGPLHMGHVRTFTLGDVMARYQRMRGRDVLYCLEFDAFGLPNELAARERGVSPEELTRANIDLISGQMRAMGLSYDWRHVHVTCDPRYYRWTQWLFLKLHQAGLVYRAPALLNWCPRCETTLANMQVEDRRCWRCEGRVEQRPLTQWFVRLERYSEILFESLSELDGWSDPVRHLLRGFIGPTRGAEIDFEVVGRPDRRLTAFVTGERGPEQIAALALDPEHPALDDLLAERPRGRQEMERFVAELRAVPRKPKRRRDEGDDPDPIAADTGVRSPERRSRSTPPRLSTRTSPRASRSSIPPPPPAAKPTGSWSGATVWTQASRCVPGRGNGCAGRSTSGYGTGWYPASAPGAPRSR
jgi:leucyl-tRNA synthetase